MTNYEIWISGIGTPTPEIKEFENYDKALHFFRTFEINAGETLIFNEITRDQWDIRIG